MTTTHITAENVTDYPAGTEVEFNYGPLHGTERGIVTGFETNRFGTHLIARTDNGAIKSISNFTDIGIGCYLITVADKAQPNRNSPWYRD